MKNKQIGKKPYVTNVIIFFEGKLQTRIILVNPCHGYGFPQGCDFQTRTRTRNLSRVGNLKPVTIPSPV